MLFLYVCMINCSGIISDSGAFFISQTQENVRCFCVRCPGKNSRGIFYIRTCKAGSCQTERNWHE
jgi:hypothetical protein